MKITVVKRKRYAEANIALKRFLPANLWPIERTGLETRVGTTKM